MSASNHLNPKQLFLFATGRELMNHVEDSVDLPLTNDKNKENLWRWKSIESVGRGYPQQFSHEGIKTPVTIKHIPGSKLIMGQGHHRVATSAMLEAVSDYPLMVPVVYDADFNYSHDPRGYRNDYPFGEKGQHHEFAKNNPPGQWAGLTESQIRQNRYGHGE